MTEVPPAPKAPFSRRAVPPVGVTPPQRRSTGQIADAPPAAIFVPVPLPAPPVQAPVIAPPPEPAVAARAQESALDAYLQFAREGTVVSDDYYPGKAEAAGEHAAPVLIVAESLIPTGKPRLAPQPDKPRGPKIIAALVVLAVAGGGIYYETHQVKAPVVTGSPPVTLDQTTATTSAAFSVPAAATSGASYHLTVPAGWKATSQPTHPGGAHHDVTVNEPILGLSVAVDSDGATAPKRSSGTPVDTSLRIFGHPAGVVAPTTAAGSAMVSRIATVTQHGVRYAVTLTVPRESASRDYGRAEVVARSLTDTP